MGFRSLAALFSVVGIGCGSSANPPESPATDDAGGAPVTNVFSGDASVLCASDADCPSGDVCRLVRIGEVSQSLCVPDTVKATDAGTGTGTGVDAASSDASTLVRDASANDVVTPAVTDAAVDAPPSTPCPTEATVVIANSGPTTTCVFNTTVTQSSPATLHYTCGKDGSASVTFGSQLFTGTVTAAGQVSLKNVDSYNFDAYGITCNYTSTQTITGPLSSGTLQYSYTEVLSSNQPTACHLLTKGCWENGSVTLN